MILSFAKFFVIIKAYKGAVMENENKLNTMSLATLVEKIAKKLNINEKELHVYACFDREYHDDLPKGKVRKLLEKEYSDKSNLYVSISLENEDESILQFEILGVNPHKTGLDKLMDLGEYLRPDDATYDTSLCRPYYLIENNKSTAYYVSFNDDRDKNRGKNFPEFIKKVEFSPEKVKTIFISNLLNKPLNDERELDE